MKTLTYTPTLTGKTVGLRRAPGTDLAEAAWQEFAENIAREEHLIAYPIAELRRRWQQGRAAIAIENNRIIGYSSVVLNFSEAVWLELSRAVGVDPDQMSPGCIYKMATGWIDPAWRRQGVYVQLRRRLLVRLGGPDNLCVSTTIGPKAPFLLAKLGWQVVGWARIAYVSSLIGWFAEDRLYQVGGGWRPLAAPGMEPYEGEHLAPTPTPSHEWARFYHLWVSSVPLAMTMNRQLATLLNGDLPRWRAAILAVFSTRQDNAD